MAYDLEAVKKKLASLSAGRNQGTDRVKLNWFKPALLPDGSKNTYEIRFLPYEDKNGQPFEEVSYYDNRELTDRRFVAPAQFDMPDPIFDLFNELRQENTKETWKLMQVVRPKDKFYAPLIVRGEEDQGVRVWELNSKVLTDIYGYLAHPDYADENMMDPDAGFDFTLSVTDSGKKYNKWTIKNYDLVPRRKPSKLSNSKKEQVVLIGSVPKLHEYFKAQVMDKERIDKIVENFLSSRAGGSVEPNEEDVNDKNSASKGTTSKDISNAATKSIEDAFADLDADEVF